MISSSVCLSLTVCFKKILWLCDPSLHAPLFLSQYLCECVPVWLCLYKSGLISLYVSLCGLCPCLYSWALFMHEMWVSMQLVSLCGWLIVTILSVSGWLCLYVSLFAVAICQNMCAYICVLCVYVCVSNAWSLYMDVSGWPRDCAYAPFYVSVPLTKKGGGEGRKGRGSKKTLI